MSGAWPDETSGTSVGDRITVGPDPADLAKAITAVGVDSYRLSPHRSHPDSRPSPPGFELGRKTRVPAPLRRRRSGDLHLRVPPSYGAVFVTAPLAYYLGATVRTGADGPPALAAPGAGLRHELSPMPDLQHAAADMLQRVFFLDCLVRATASNGRPDDHVTPAGFDAAAALDVDPRRLRDADLPTRVARYLEVSDEILAGVLPDWHLSTFVAPEREHVPCLPRLLDSLSLVYLPVAEACSPNALLEYTLEESLADAAVANRPGRTVATRGNATSPVRDGDVAVAGSDHSATERTGSSTRRVLPAGDDSHVTAWLAPGTPLGAFKATPGALDRAHALADRPSTPGTVRLVRTAADVDAEFERALAAYREAPAVTSVDTSRAGTTTAVRDALADPATLVHFLGHCDDAGLRCRDGWVDVADLESVDVDAVVLNACDSYEQGLAAVERGCVAGVVTVADVLERQATTVGITLVRLLCRGFAVERAARLASQRILMSSDYVVVGDGTFRPFEPDEPPAVLRIDRVESETDEVRLRAHGLEPDRTGHRVPVPGFDRARLNGDAATRTCSRAALADVLEDVRLPAVYGGEFYWAADLAETFRD